ncbi:Radical SAM domain protein [Desulfomicrobium baculatum DSM 4028]|uniref:Radical SAM domain protein n=2 Tax=Desulfomicrobium baculatum TaxID=899 RepID=C7LQ00_DESBD|nr:Radical SAM domain protein [Desulfomicrobium baculatum DSM 4028]
MHDEQTRDHFIKMNAREYGPIFNYINWITEERARLATQERARLLQTPGVSVSCLGTKIHHGPLSPGCRQCSGLAWSCLFISGRCNGRCFYCPAPQNMDDPPMSGSVPFHHAQDYADYVRFFGFGGASVSGGEPFLDFDKSLAFVQALRRTCDPALHIWLYTNGILVTEDKLQKLAAAGLNEIRFDIGATDYDLKFARQAAGIVATVTVEIPAVPEEAGRLETLLPELTAAGVSHLNLHQLRLTPHNARHLLEHDYTYIHGPKVTVLESELCALKLVAHAAAHKLELAVNYCSFVYKYRFQAAASRGRFGVLLLENGELLTDSGHIRTAATTAAATRPGSEPPVPGEEDSLETNQASSPTYAAAFVRPLANPEFAHREISVSAGFTVFLERHPARPTAGAAASAPVADPDIAGLYQPSLEESCEWIAPGLGVYF